MPTMGYMSGPFPFRTRMWIGGWQHSGLIYRINEREVEEGNERKGEEKGSLITLAINLKLSDT